jgi:hypothetical protein
MTDRQTRLAIRNKSQRTPTSKKASKQIPGMPIEPRHIGRHIPTVEREIQPPPDGHLVLFGMDQFGDWILLAGLLDEGDKERSLVLEQAALEQLHQGGDGDTFFGEGGFDFFESREGSRSWRASAGSRRGARGSAVARRAGVGFQGHG